MLPGVIFSMSSPRIRTKKHEFCAVYMPQCAAIARVVSGDPPATAKAPYYTPDLYPVGGSPNFAAVATDGLANCTVESLYQNSQIGPTGDPSERLYASFGEACEGILGEDGLVGSPEVALKYNCTNNCVEWLINYGVCGATDLKQVRIIVVYLALHLCGFADSVECESNMGFALRNAAENKCDELIFFMLFPENKSVNL